MERFKLSYLYIFEDGSCKIGEVPSEGDLLACGDGYLTLIDTYKQCEYHQGSWQPLELLEKA